MCPMAAGNDALPRLSERHSSTPWASGSTDAISAIAVRQLAEREEGAGEHVHGHDHEPKEGVDLRVGAQRDGPGGERSGERQTREERGRQHQQRPPTPGHSEHLHDQDEGGARGEQPEGGEQHVPGHDLFGLERRRGRGTVGAGPAGRDRHAAAALDERGLHRRCGKQSGREEVRIRHPAQRRGIARG